MLQYVTRRLAAGVLTVVVTVILGFALLSAGSSGTARTILGPAATEAQITAKSAELGLDRPFFERLFSWMGGAVRGDLGTSWINGQPVADTIASRLPVTLSLVLCTMLVAVILAFVLGTLSAYFGGWMDRVVQAGAMIGFTLPGFLVALLLVLVVAVQWGLLPATGYVPLATDPTQWATHLVLPVAALAVFVVADASQQVRNAVLDVMSRDYIRTLRSRGLPEWRILSVNVLRNASVAGITVLGLQTVGLLGGVVIEERIFSLPGIGELVIRSSIVGDAPIILGVILVTSTLVVLINLAIDVIVALVNPRTVASR